MMPILVILCVVIAVFALTIDGALAGLKYYLLPDFQSSPPQPFSVRSVSCSIRCRWQWVS